MLARHMICRQTCIALSNLMQGRPVLGLTTAVLVFPVKSNNVTCFGNQSGSQALEPRSLFWNVQPEDRLGGCVGCFLWSRGPLSSSWVYTRCCISTKMLRQRRLPANILITAPTHTYNPTRLPHTHIHTHTPSTHRDTVINTPKTPVSIQTRHAQGHLQVALTHRSGGVEEQPSPHTPPSLSDRKSVV